MKHDTGVALELYLTGLRNAHALEQEALSMMQRQIDRLEHYPGLAKRLREHRTETEVQIERLELILAEFDEGPSAKKDMGGTVMGNLAALGHTMMGDEVLKNTFASYAFESFEIASYTSLIVLADATGQTAHTKALEQTLGEEIAMAGWLEDNIKSVTLRFLELSERGKTAKV